MPPFARERIYAVGDGGTILHAADGGRTWLAQKSGQKTALRAVWGSGAEDVYAVGDKGRILHSTDHGGSWVAEKSGTTLELRAVWGSGADDVYATGGDADKVECAILRSTDGGKTWKRVHAGGGSLFAIGGSGKQDVYAAGSDETLQSRVLRSVDGGATSGGPGIPHGVWVEGAGRVDLASGGGGFLHSIDGGKTWTEEKTGTTADLEAIWGSGADDLFAVGCDGVILRTVRRKAERDRAAE